jgi:hypothetical protein
MNAWPGELHPSLRSGVIKVVLFEIPEGIQAVYEYEEASVC